MVSALQSGWHMFHVLAGWLRAAARFVSRRRAAVHRVEMQMAQAKSYSEWERLAQAADRLEGTPCSAAARCCALLRAVAR